MCCTNGQSCAAQPLRVLLLLSDNYPSYQSVSLSVQQKMPEAQMSVQLLNQSVQFSQYDAIVAFGLSATDAAAQQSELPLLSIFVPELAYNSLIKKLNKPSRVGGMAAIYLNQPWSRQLDFISALLPTQRNVAVLYHSGNLPNLTSLREEAHEHGQVLIAQAINADQPLFNQLENLLSQTQILLATPDSNIYSSSNVRNILLSTYRFNVPVIGFSANYVNAGALAAIFASPEQIATQSVAILQKIKTHQTWQGAQYPNTFSIALNAQIARSLGITLISEAQIRQTMQHDRRSDYD